VHFLDLANLGHSILSSTKTTFEVQTLLHHLYDMLWLVKKLVKEITELEMNVPYIAWKPRSGLQLPTMVQSDHPEWIMVLQPC
jgi:hypothetical protein